MKQKKLQKLVHYNQHTGVLTARKKLGNRIVGSILGSHTMNGYRAVSIKKKHFLVHRLAFLYMTGEMPEQVDHMNQVRDDNRWINLQASTNKQNSRNHTLRSTNTSGWTGVNWGTRENKWRARIMVDGGEIYLGTFHNIEDAIEARRLANIKYGFHINHGKKKTKKYFKYPSSFVQ